MFQQYSFKLPVKHYPHLRFVENKFILLPYLKSLINVHEKFTLLRANRVKKYQYLDPEKVSLKEKTLEAFSLSLSIICRFCF